MFLWDNTIAVRARVEQLGANSMLETNLHMIVRSVEG